MYGEIVKGREEQKERNRKAKHDSQCSMYFHKTSAMYEVYCVAIKKQSAQLVYQEEFSSKSEALKREAEVKGWRRERKEQLLSKH